MSGELEGFFEGSFGKGRKVWREVVAIEKEVRNLEDERLQTLKGLLEVLEDVKVNWGDGRVGIGELVGAMDEIGLGLSAG